MPNPKRTQADRDIVLALHAQDKGRNDIVRETGYSTAWVSKVVKEAGMSFARSERVKAATEAKTQDNKTRRANIIGRLYKQAEDILTRLEADTFSTLVPTGPGIQSARDLDFIPPGDHRNLATSIAIFMDKALLLEKTDTDTSGTAAVDKWLEYMTSAPLPTPGGAEPSTPSPSPESPS
ncbi:hypothetical protein [Arthrobacter sp. Soil763]|uniref:hypothetical protein n=1 Tax=Arthrobacter sp. Soil763 TaxID=1736402 RepID=UPI00070118B3|nr:hypothetical protein [Arthrobacter sp. Soil763]KRE79958.1 hypothetical protein ASG71_07950 [Arthrobacter sp. Soil763]